MTRYRYCYDVAAKEAFHRTGRKILRKVAKDLQLSADSYDLRSIKGGIAIFGEITLHTDRLYLQISGSTEPARILYRSCEGRTDYTGGSNYFLSLEDLTDPARYARTLATLRAIHRGNGR